MCFAISYLRHKYRGIRFDKYEQKAHILSFDKYVIKLFQGSPDHPLTFSASLNNFQDSAYSKYDSQLRFTVATESRDQQGSARSARGKGLPGRACRLPLSACHESTLSLREDAPFLPLKTRQRCKIEGFYWGLVTKEPSVHRRCGLSE